MGRSKRQPSDEPRQPQPQSEHGRISQESTAAAAAEQIQEAGTSDSGEARRGWLLLAGLVICGALLIGGLVPVGSEGASSEHFVPALRA
jgi:hypothetical protein